jgi:hypothetical protein
MDSAHTPPAGEAAIPAHPNPVALGPCDGYGCVRSRCADGCEVNGLRGAVEQQQARIAALEAERDEWRRRFADLGALVKGGAYCPDTAPRSEGTCAYTFDDSEKTALCVRHGGIAPADEVQQYTRDGGLFPCSRSNPAARAEAPTPVATDAGCAYRFPDTACGGPRKGHEVRWVGHDFVEPDALAYQPATTAETTARIDRRDLLCIVGNGETAMVYIDGGEYTRIPYCAKHAIECLTAETTEQNDG